MNNLSFTFSFWTITCFALVHLCNECTASNAQATEVRNSLHYFKAAISTMQDPELFGDINRDAKQAEALLEELLKHEADTSSQKNGASSVHFACSGTYATGPLLRELLLEHSAKPQPIHSSEYDDTVCFFAHLTRSEAKELKQSAAVMSDQILGLIVPYPSIFKLGKFPRVKSDSGKLSGVESDSQLAERIGEWAASEDHMLQVAFAPLSTKNPILLEDPNGWLTSRLEDLTSNTAQKDFFFSSGIYSETDHGERFGTGSIARAWSGILPSTAKSHIGECSHAEVLAINASGWRPHVSEFGPRATIRGHHMLGALSKADTEFQEKCVREILVALVTAPDVIGVEVITLKQKAANMAAARLVQAGGTDNTIQPLWNAGFDGTGQIIQVGDSGLDQYHCMFHDSVYGPIPVSKVTDDSYPSYYEWYFSYSYSYNYHTDTARRKVVQYIEGIDGDGADCPVGHGTHVAGSAGGSLASTYTVTVADTCNSDDDPNGVIGCEVPNYYTSGCEDYTEECYDTNFYGFSGSMANACDQACYCSRDGTYLGAAGATCEEMIEDSSGSAKGAKLAILDLQPREECATGAMLVTGQLLYAYYWDAAYNISQNSRISTHSWGGGNCDGSYDSDSVYTDLYTWYNPDFTVLYAAGNDGASCEDDGSIGSPATAKNSIAVGASETGRWPTDNFNSYSYSYDYESNSPNELAYFSSVGPTADGRYKPDVVAPGYYVVSANSSGYDSTESCSVTYMAGTSMATPIAAGGAAIIRQYFTDNNGYTAHISALSSFGIDTAYYSSGERSYISSSLVKAIMVNGAETIWSWNDYAGFKRTFGSTPTFEQGFGRLALINSMPVSSTVSPSDGGNFLFVADHNSSTGLVSGEGRTYLWKNEQSSGTQRALRVTLVWNDPPNINYLSATKRK